MPINKNKKPKKNKSEPKKGMTDEELIVHARNSAIIFKLGGKTIDGLLVLATSPRVWEREFALRVIRVAWNDRRHELQLAQLRRAILG